jgi:hypothetical protein
LNRLSLATALLVVVLGAACAYHGDDEPLWGNCCALQVAGEESAPKERDTLMAWGGTIGFRGDGTSRDWEGTKAWRRRQIAYGFAVFQERHPASQARDYLVGLGMTCAPLDNDLKARRERCAVELPVWATCTAKFGWPYSPPPVPRELRKPIAAVLQMTIDVSGSDVLDSSVRVVPVPGGRLCERQ